jgi:hypothetical protein
MAAGKNTASPFGFIAEAKLRQDSLFTGIAFIALAMINTFRPYRITGSKKV